jgi:DNA replication protein DnaC
MRTDRSKLGHFLNSPEVIGGPTIADAILARIIHHAHLIDLNGPSLQGPSDE